MRAATWLQAWDSQGVHRTGTPGDTAGAEWLAREAAALGAEVAMETFPLSRLDPIQTWIECDGRQIESVPVFDAPSTTAEGVTGDIALVPLSPWSVYTPEYQALRRGARHAGLVIVCEGGEPGLALLNAEHFRDPYGCPAVHVAAMPPAAPSRLVSLQNRTETAARNVVVTLPGRDRGRPPRQVTEMADRRLNRFSSSRGRSAAPRQWRSGSSRDGDGARSSPAPAPGRTARCAR